jgi:glycosyltransferase involved in cell wall biosynthesis
LPSAGAGLRVLMVMHTPASMELGGARVQLELAEVLREHGCEVRVLDRDEILGERPAGRLGVSQGAFSAAAMRSVAVLAREYDVVDAHQGNLPVAKARLGFDGLMVTRSVGLEHLYAEFLRASQARWPDATRGHLLARPIRRWRRRRSLRAATRTYELCDLVIVPNRDERIYLSDRLHIEEKIAVLPLGIAERRLRELQAAAGGRARAPRRVAFIGDWSARKGSHDWPDILARVRRRLPDTSFVFLGTRLAAGEVARDLGVGVEDVEVVPAYGSDELQRLLDGVRVGALPSYIEGLGLGVLEKLAAGIPSVCYDVPGPRETVGRVDPTLLVAAGDTEAFAARLVELLELEEERYERLSERCCAVAAEFSWRLIGAQTLAAYRDGLSRLSGPLAARR